MNICLIQKYFVALVVEKEATNRLVYLLKGDIWIDINNRKEYNGGQ
jgi:alpha-glucosidase (family GH31 glycosyl hydrolase)